MQMENLEYVLTTKSHDLFGLQEYLDRTVECNAKLVESLASFLIDNEYINEVKAISQRGTAALFFGNTLRDLKVVIQDDGALRDHEILLQYKAPKKLIISKVNLPQTPLQNQEFSCLDEVIESFRSHINDLARYFHELESIDRFCTVIEPANATYKDTYRKILLDNRTWLHVEVTPEGVARNIHLIGQSPDWYNKLQAGLSSWDHDIDIVENIMSIFDLTEFPKATTLTQDGKIENTENEIECAICLCGEIPEVLNMPQPLCQNTACGVYYHGICLYQWLVACAGNRPPALGIASGECPRCHQSITCSNRK